MQTAKPRKMCNNKLRPVEFTRHDAKALHGLITKELGGDAEWKWSEYSHLQHLVLLRKKLEAEYPDIQK